MKIDNSNKKEIRRKCVVTNQIYHIDDLLRFVKTKNGQIFLDFEKKILGRGCYVKNDKETIDYFFTKHLINRSFRMKIDSEILANLKREWEKHNEEQKKI